MSWDEYHDPNDTKEPVVPPPGDRFFRTAHKTFTSCNIITASVWVEAANRGEKCRRAGFKITNNGSTVMRSWSGERANFEDYFTVQTFGDAEVGTFADALEWIGQTLRRFGNLADEKKEAAEPVRTECAGSVKP